MSVLFIIPLTVIALYESTLDGGQNAWVDNWLRGNDEAGDDSPSYRDPQLGDEENGLQISKVPFMELTKVFPNLTQVSAPDAALIVLYLTYILKSSETAVLTQIQEVKTQLAESSHVAGLHHKN